MPTPDPNQLYPQAVEDLNTRDPEWQPMTRGYGHELSGFLEVEWDPVHRKVRTTGPVVQVNRRDRPK